MGLLLAVFVSAADVDDAKAAQTVFGRLAGQPTSKVTRMFADRKYHNHALYGWVQDNADLETICLKCLPKEPVRRYDSAQDLAEDLERWLRDEPIAARPVGKMERTWKWIKRRPTTAALIGVSSLAGMMILIGSLITNALIAAKQSETADALHKMNAAFQELSEEQQKTKQALQREEQAAY